MASSKLEGVRLFLEVRENCLIQCGLFEASSRLTISPGSCLDRVEFELPKGRAGWVEIPFSVEIENPGWHFLEFSWGDSVVLHQQDNAPVGILLHRVVNSPASGIKNPYSEFSPETSRVPGPSSAPMIETVPEQPVYRPENLTNERTRPDRLPHLWISEPTDFRYPEFLEFHWEKPREISSIDLVFDSSSEFIIPPRPEKFSVACVTSVVSHYKIFSWTKSVTGRNCSKFRIMHCLSGRTNFQRFQPRQSKLKSSRRMGLTALKFIRFGHTLEPHS